MSNDDNPFDDLELDDDVGLDGGADPEADDGTVAESQNASEDHDSNPLDEMDIDPSDEPGFKHDDVVQIPFYAREEEAWKKFRLAMKKTDLELEETFGAEDVRKSELHDAALRVAAEHRLEILEKVAETRGQTNTQTGDQ